MRVNDAEDLRQLIIDEAAAMDQDELYGMAMDIFSTSSFCIIPVDKERKETLDGTAYIKRWGLGRYSITFYECFLRDFAKTPADCLFLLLHELSHERQGDLTRPHIESLDGATSNVVADIMINANLCRRWFPDGVPMFSLFYGAKGYLKMFQHFLIPPMTLFNHYASEIQSCYRSFDLPPLAPFSYRDHREPELRQLIKLLSHVLIITRQSDATERDLRNCANDTAAIYVEGWFGRPVFEDLFNRMSRLFEDCFECSRCHNRPPSQMRKKLMESQIQIRQRRKQR